jgi:hypothetical protein
MRLIVCLAAVALLAGCGGSAGHPASGTTARLSATPVPDVLPGGPPNYPAGAGKPCTRAQLGKTRGALTCRAKADPALGFKAMTWQP